MQPEEMRERARELFTNRLHCSQVMLTVGLEKLGIDAPDAIKALGAYGGGIGGSGNVCGVMLGAVAVAGVMYSRSSLDEKENPRMWGFSHKIMKKFRELTEQHGGINCSNIARVNWQDRDEVKNFYTNPESRRKECIKLIGDAAYALGELLEQEAAKE